MHLVLKAHLGLKALQPFENGPETGEEKLAAPHFLVHNTADTTGVVVVEDVAAPGRLGIRPGDRVLHSVFGAGGQ